MPAASSGAWSGPVDPRALLSPETLEDPHAFFRSLREQGPLHAVGDTGVHLVTRWAEIADVLGREADFSANLTGVLIRGAGGQPALFEIPGTGATDVIATADEPAHGVHRALLQPSLTPGRVAALEEKLRHWSDDAVRAFVEAGGGDFTRAVAEPIPARSVLDLLGLPETDLDRVRPWAMMGGDMLAGAVDATRMAWLGEQTRQMSDYLAAHLASALDRPRAERGGPLARALAAGVETGRVALSEAVGIAIVLFGAGGESTAALIGSAVRLLAADPALADRLRDEPSLIPRYVEEVVRLEPPFKGHYRVVRRSCRLADRRLSPGDRLFLLWASANRDSEIFERPDALDLERRHPKQHLGFGRGAHFCIGAPLARLETRIVLETLLGRTVRIESIAEDPPRHVPSLFVRRLDRLPLAVSA